MPNNLPPSFVAEAEKALADQDRTHLLLQRLEIEGLPWEVEARSFLQDLLAKAEPHQSAERVVLFSGHRVDSPTRERPRFPANAEPIAREAIHQMLARETKQGAVTGLAGGANGGDILFLESCRALNIPFEMLLILPEPQFIEQSVASPIGNWVERFHALAQQPRPRVLQATEALPDWLAGKPGYSIWARNNLWMIASALALSPRFFTLAALWDGAAGDGPGGTEHMAQTAQQHGAHFIHLDTRVLFAGVSAIRSAKP